MHADVVDWAPVLALTPKDGDVEKLYAALKGKHPSLDVYRSSEIPAEYRSRRTIRGCPRSSAIAKEGWYIASKRTVRRWGEPDRRAPGGSTATTRARQSMQGLFIASGPRIRRGLQLQAVREHSRLRIHVRGARAAAGEERRRSGRDPRYAPIQSMTANSDRITAAGWKIVLLASLGGTLEFYDFVIFGVFARDIADAVFPATDPLVSLILSYATFAVGYLARPIGGIVLSHYGDRYGRRAVFLWSVFIMSGATLGMGLVPDYAKIGVAASLLMVTLRLIQGFCLGGELPGALTYVVETAPRIAPFVCGVVFACVTMGVAVATGVSLSVRTYMDPALVPAYGWRIAFVLGGLGGVLSFVLRRSLEESPEFARMRSLASRQPFTELLRTNFVHVLIGCALLAGTGCFNGLFFSHLPGVSLGRAAVRSAAGGAGADGRRDRVGDRHPGHGLDRRSHSAAVPAARRRRAAAGICVAVLRRARIARDEPDAAVRRWPD